MSFLDSIKQSALEVLHGTVNALHAQFAASLAQAGHPVTAEAHVDTLVQTAVKAGNGSGNGVAPNYADHALATFSTSMTAALLQFAQAHLPAKFQGAAEEAASTATAAIEGKHMNLGDIAETALKIGADVAAAVVPGAAPIVAIAEPLVEAVVKSAAAGASVEQAATPVVAAVAPVAEQAANQLASAVTADVAAEADKALPGAGALVTALEGAAVAAVTAPTPASADTAPSANTQGM